MRADGTARSCRSRHLPARSRSAHRPRPTTSIRQRVAGRNEGAAMCSRRRITYTETCSVAPAVSLRVAAPIASPSPRPPPALPARSCRRCGSPRTGLSSTRGTNRLRHWGGSLGSIPSVSRLRSRPAKPSDHCLPQSRPARRCARRRRCWDRGRGRGRGLAQVAQRHLRIAEARRDQRVHPRASELPWAQRGS